MMWARWRHRLKCRRRKVKKKVSGKSLSNPIQKSHDPEKSTEVKEISLNAGHEYTLKAEDMALPNPWEAIGERNGISPEKLQAFNMEEKGYLFWKYKVLVNLAEGIKIYIPSADELAFSEFRHKYPTYTEAVTAYGTYLTSTDRKVLHSARNRASGENGEKYGTNSTTFNTPNSKLAGASKSRSSVLNGQRKYKV